MTSAGLGNFNMTCLLQDSIKLSATDIIMERLLLKTFVTSEIAFVMRKGKIRDLFLYSMFSDVHAPILLSDISLGAIPELAENPEQAPCRVKFNKGKISSCSAHTFQERGNCMLSDEPEGIFLLYCLIFKYLFTMS